MPVSLQSVDLLVVVKTCFVMQRGIGFDFEVVVVVGVVVVVADLFCCYFF